MNVTSDGPGPEPDLQVDPVTIDLIENALKSVRREMDAVVFRTAMSPIIREEHDAFPLISDAEGRMIVGQFGWDLGSTLFNYFPREEMRPGDVIIQNDPYLCAGAIQHTPDLLVARPLFHHDELVGIGSIFGNLADIGTAVPGSMPTTATSIFEEGIRFPPVKLYDAGTLNQAVLDILARNTRLPDMNVADVMALSAAVRLAETRIAELCDRFGRDTYVACTDALLERTRRAMKRLIAENIPEQPDQLRGLHRRRRPRKRPVQDEAHLLPEGRKGSVRLDRHLAAGARTNQPDAVGGHVQDRHRRVPHHGV